MGAVGIHRERAGLAITADSDAAVERYDALLDDYVAARPTLPDRLRDLLAVADAMPMAHVAHGVLMMLSGKGEALPRARRSAERAAALAATAQEREALHAAALGAWTDGDEHRARRTWNEILASHPLDILALKLAQFSHFYAGESRAMLGTTLRSLQDWTPDDPRYSYALGCHAFSLEECGRFDEAERCGREAVERQSEDPWAIHAVAHVLESTDRWDEGIAWIDGLAPDWRGHATMDGHLRWHRALLQIDRGDAAAVLADFDDGIHVADSEEYLDLCNDVALLQRLELCGLDAGERWQRVADALAPRLADHMLVFCDAHYVLALAAAGRFASAEGQIAALRDAAERDGAAAGTLREIGVPLCEALLAWRRDDPSGACEGLWRIRGGLHRIGGSHAQRDLFEQILIAAATGCGRRDLARALLLERCARMPHNQLARTRLAALEDAG